MKLSLERNDLAGYVRRQIENVFPDGADLPDLARLIETTLERVEHCFSRIGIKGFQEAGQARFNHRHTDQYALFLYYLSNSAFRAADGAHPVAEKAYALNKALHAVDAFYEVALPDIMLFSHPVGTVLGRGEYRDYFCCYHGCTVGANLDDDYPVIGRGVVMYGGSKIIGDTQIGNNTFIANGAVLIDEGALAPNSVLYGTRPHVGVAGTERDVIRDIFRTGD
jgi:serine O-acetyltransferase